LSSDVKYDGFTMPVADFDILESIKTRCLKQGLDINKSILIRAGIHALDQLDDCRLKMLIISLPVIKTGRKPKDNNK